jgi:hypothetical protein
MKISNPLLTLTGTITNQLQSAEIQTANQHSVMREASEEIESPQSWQNGHLKSKQRH